VIDADGKPVPLWRVQVPATVARHVTATLDQEALGATSRAEDLDLLDPAETGESLQEPWHSREARLSRTRERSGGAWRRD
jgi:hypothetical protein